MKISPSVRKGSRCRWAQLLFLACLAGAVMPARSDVNVLSYWRLGESDTGAANGAIATNLVDAVGGLNLTVTGPAMYVRATSASAFSSVASTLSLNLTNSSYAVGPIVSAALDNFGMEVWVKPFSVDGDNPQVLVYNGHTGRSGAGMFIQDGNFNALYGGQVVFGSFPATPGVWTHLALVQTNTVATLFVNGVAVATQVGIAPANPSPGFAIGCDPQRPGNEVYTGLIDEVRFFTCPNGFTTNDLLLNARAPTLALGTGALLEGNASGSDTITVGANPPTNTWTAAPNAAWLHVTSSTITNSTNLPFAFDANSGPARSGTLTIGGLTLTVTQAGATYAPAQALPVTLTYGDHPYSVAVDYSGDVFFSSYQEVEEWTPASNFAGIVDNATDFPGALALDGAGDLFIGSTTGLEVLGATNGIITGLVTAGVPSPQALAVDGACNLYVANTSSNLIQELPAGQTALLTLVSNASITQGVAVDVAGNVYFDTSAPSVMEWNNTMTNPVTVVSSDLNYPYNLAVDGSGNIYIADTQDYVVKKWSVLNQALSVLPTNGLFAPAGVAVDDAGDVFIGDSSANAVFELVHAFVNTNGATLPQTGTRALPLVLPATANLLAPFLPVSDSVWLTISAGAPGLVTFYVTENTSGALRTANVTVLGQVIPITQQYVGSAPNLNPPTLLGPGVVQFSFTGDTNASYTVVTTTDLTVPLSSWLVVGPILPASGNTYQFTSPSTASDARRFYAVISP